MATTVAGARLTLWGLAEQARPRAPAGTPITVDVNE